MAAYHDGGQRDGDFYDSDFGGALYVASEEGLVLPKLESHEHRNAKAKPDHILHRVP